MRLWKTIVLVDLALVLGLAGGYLWWAREVRTLREELVRAQETAAGRQPAQRAWTARGIVRLVLRDRSAVFLTHETIAGLMEGMTMGFQATDVGILDGLAPGDRVFFVLEQRDGRLVLVAIRKDPRP